jgi:hypothetical protein
MSGDVLGVRSANGVLGTDTDARAWLEDGVEVFCARRAWSALRRYSDLGAAAELGRVEELDRVKGGRSGSGLERRSEGSREKGGVDMTAGTSMEGNGSFRVSSQNVVSVRVGVGAGVHIVGWNKVARDRGLFLLELNQSWAGVR